MTRDENIFPKKSLLKLSLSGFGQTYFFKGHLAVWSLLAHRVPHADIEPSPECRTAPPLMNSEGPIQDRRAVFRMHREFWESVCSHPNSLHCKIAIRTGILHSEVRRIFSRPCIYVEFEFVNQVTKNVSRMYVRICYKRSS